MASVPRLMPGQGTIVAVGALGYPPEWRDVPEARLRELGVAKVMTMTSTYDHRVIQGAQSGEFLGRIEALLDGADDFYASVFESLGIGLPAADIPRTQRRDAARRCRRPPQRRRRARCRRAQMLGAVQAATSLIKAHRTHGHLGAHLDPLGTPPIGDPAMEPETYGLTPDLMEQIPADVLRVYVPGTQPRRGSPQPAPHLLRHDRLRDRAHRQPRAARVAARAHRVGRVPDAVQPRPEAAAAPAAHQGRGDGALPAPHLHRPEDVLRRGRRRHDPDARGPADAPSRTTASARW